MLKQQANNKEKVALYSRLSRDDGLDKESNSIANQREMLKRYAKENKFYVYDEYIDDGFSGTTFNRPALNRMFEDIEAGKVNVVLVKDMSRLGRNNALFMYYVEEVFPDLDVRFIAINDMVDTAQDDNEIMPFKSVLNEYYARDISKKIRSSIRTTALTGGFTGAFAPYGYLVDPENKKKLIVDPETAPIVKRIFELSQQGTSTHQIARILCKDGILVPRAYRAKKKGILEQSKGFTFPTDWVGKNVKMILENQVYLGHMVSHKSQTKSFKNKKIVPVPKEDWIVVENTHEAIIDVIKEEHFHYINIEINTVDRFQGKEKEIIIVSLVRNTKSERRSIDSHIAAFQRINVGFSRAQNLLIVVGASEMYANQPVMLTDMDNGEKKEAFVYKEIIEMLDMKGTYYQSDDIITDVVADEVFESIKEMEVKNQ